jgi:1-acyl-sn-glycerol-3-phosphate acyltransferase
MAFLKNFLRFFYSIWGLFIFGVFILTTYFIALIAFWMYGKRSFFKLFPWYKGWSNAWLFLMGIKIDVEGLAHFKPKTSYIVVGNHSSTLDIFAMASGIPFPFKALAKRELGAIPIVGFLFKSGCVHVDRENPESRKRSVEEVKQELKQGFSILIMPEGTRNKSPQALGPFKDGAFRIAIEMQIPIMPVVILNIRNLMPHPKMLIQGPGKFKVKFMEPVQVDGWKESDMPKLKEQLYHQLEAELLANDSYFVDRN